MRKVIKIFGIIVAVFLLFALLLKILLIVRKLPTSPIKSEEIGSVQIINLDRSKDRRDAYEKMLNDNFGDEFFGKKISSELRLSATDGVRDLAIIELDNDGKEVENVDISKLKKGEIKLKANVKYKVFDKNYPEFAYSYKLEPEKIVVDKKKSHQRHLTVGEFGCMLSHLRAIRNVSNSDDGDIGLVIEDDVYIPSDFYDSLQLILHEAPSNFSIIKLDSAKGGGKDNNFRFNTHTSSFLFSDLFYGYSEYFYNAKAEIIHGVAGTTGYLITKEYAKQLTELFKVETINGFEGASDMLLFLLLPKKYNADTIWIVKKPILWQKGFKSQISLMQSRKSL